MLFNSANNGARGNAETNIVTNPYWRTTINKKVYTYRSESIENEFV